MTLSWFRGRGFLVDADFARESAARQFSTSVVLMVVLTIVGGLLFATRWAERDSESPTSMRAERAKIALARPIPADVRYVDKSDNRYQFGTAVAVNEH